MIRLLSIIALILLFAACSSGGDEDPVPTANILPTNAPEAAAQQIQATPEPALPLNSDGLQLIAMVNGQGITLEEFERAFTYQRGLSEAGGYDTIAANVVDMLIEQELIAQAAARMNIAVTDEELNAQLTEYRGLVADDAAWQQWLQTNNFEDEGQFVESLRDDLLTKRVIEAITAPAEAAEPVSEVHARHILVQTEAEANDLLTRLNNGEDFAQLAAQFSRDVTTREQGGDLGWFTIDGLLTPELAQLAFTLQPNQIAGPVQTMLGYHVIQLIETNQRSALPEEQSRLAAEQFTNWLQTLLEDAIIERYIEF